MTFHSSHSSAGANPQQFQPEPPAWDPKLYDAKLSFVWQKGADLLKLLDAKPGERILDLGCGTGQLTALIAASGATVTGVDSSPEMVQQARANFPELTLLVGDAVDLNFSQPFDAIFSNAALHWIKEAERAADGMARCVRSGGRLVAEFGGKGNVQHLLEAFYKGREALGLSCEENLSPWYFPNIPEYAAILESHGFEVSFATLFDRPTPLDDREWGLRHWIRMFAQNFYADLPPERHEAFFAKVEELARSDLFQNGQWHVDYRRLRITAHKL
ncbi:MAG: class I SAM-dependent methyltransferase [Candidatus Dormibacteraceae bacterium]